MTNRATVTINTDADREKVARWAQQTNLGTVVEFRKKSRSTEQNAKLHAMLSEVSEQVEWYGRKLSPTDWKNMFTASLQKANVVPGIDAGTVVTIGVSTSAMTIDEMSNLIELIYAFGAQDEHRVIFKDHPPGDSPPLETDDTDNQPVLSPEDGRTASVSSLNDEAAETSAPVAAAASFSPISDAELRTALIDFARKAFNTAGDTRITVSKRKSFIDDMREGVKEKFPASMWGKFNTIRLSAERVIDHSGELGERRRSIALDFLDCDPSELEGRGNG